MPNFKKYNYDQTAMVVISFEEQLQPNALEFTLHRLIDNHIDLSAFYDKYKNDTGGRSAYDPAILLKVILFAYSKGILTIGSTGQILFSPFLYQKAANKICSVSRALAPLATTMPHAYRILDVFRSENLGNL